MGKKFHLNIVTGKAGECDATVQACPLGGPEEHYSTAAEVREHYEELMAPYLFVMATETPAGEHRERAVASAEWERLSEVQHPMRNGIEGVIGQGLAMEKLSSDGTTSSAYGDASRALSEALASTSWVSTASRREALEAMVELISDFQVRGVALEDSLNSELRDRFHNPWFDMAGQLENSLEGTMES